MIRLVAVFVMVAGISLPAQAQDDFQTRKAVAAEYVELFIKTTDLRALAAQSMQPLFDQIAANQPDLWRERHDVLTEITMSRFTASLETSMASIDGPMARVFTLAELQAVRDFYASPEGLTVMAKMPAFMQQIMPSVMQEAMSGIADILKDLAAEGVEIK